MSPWGGDELSGRGVLTHEAVTAGHIEAHVRSNFDAVKSIDVTVNIDDQEVIDPATAASQSGGRMLQVDDRTLFVRCDVSLFYRSTDGDNDLEGWVFSAFDDPADQQQYISNLQRRSSVFDDIQLIVVEVEGYEPPPPNRGTGTDGSNVAVIAGASVGGAALLLLAAFLFMRKGKSGKSVDEDNFQSQTTPETTVPPKVAVST